MAEEMELQERLRRLQEDAARLEEKQKTLEQDLADVEHQTRRASDRAERGENSPELDSVQSQLTERRELNLRDQRDTSRAVESLRTEREDLEEWLRQMRGDTDR